MSVKDQIKALESKLESASFIEKAEIKDKIHNLKMERDGIKPSNSEIDCVGCSG